MKKSIIIGVIAILIIVASIITWKFCGHKLGEPDLSNINVKVEVVRFDKILFSVKNNPDSIKKHAEKLSIQFGEFFKAYNNGIINIGDAKSPQYSYWLQKFLTDSIIRKVYNTVQTEYPNEQKLNEELTIAYKTIKYYCPTINLPKIYTHISGFNQPLAATDSVLSISLDNYLGRNCVYYQKLGESAYLLKNHDKEQVVPNVVKAIAMLNYTYKCSEENLLSKMIENGKLLYFIKKILPKTNDSVIVNFSNYQIQYCQHLEGKMWTHLIEKKLLYNTDFLLLKQMTEPAPFTNEFARESPGMAANWLAWQIVTKYAEKTKVSLRELMEERDAQKILKLSKYRSI